jgi:hypothetical protein
MAREIAQLSIAQRPKSYGSAREDDKQEENNQTDQHD